MENSNINTDPNTDNDIIKNNHEKDEEEEKKLLSEEEKIIENKEKDINKEKDVNKEENDDNNNKENNKNNKNKNNNDNVNEENNKDNKDLIKDDNKKEEEKNEEEINDENKKEEDKKNEDKKEEDNNKDEDEPDMNEIQYSHTLAEIVKKYDIQKMPDTYNKEDVNYKVLFLGDSGVGKSSLVIRGIHNKFDSFYKPTVGFDLINYIVKINDKVIKLQIWDTCGQEEFSMCNQSLFKNATVAIMVYSINNKKSYDNIKKWVNHVKNLSKENTIFFLVGNKSDLCSQREVEFVEAKKYGKEFDFFVETSSKYGYSVDNLFKKIVIYLYENMLKNDGEENDESKSEEFITDYSSSFLDSKSYSLRKKKCLKCC